MWKMPILPKVPNADEPGSNVRCRYHSTIRPMPASYMAEYSVLGLLVADHQATLELLKAHQIPINESSEVLLDAPDRLHEITRWLERAGIEWEFADTVGGVYQG